MLKRLPIVFVLVIVVAVVLALITSKKISRLTISKNILEKEVSSLKEINLHQIVYESTTPKLLKDTYNSFCKEILTLDKTLGMQTYVKVPGLKDYETIDKCILTSPDMAGVRQLRIGLFSSAEPINLFYLITKLQKIPLLLNKINYSEKAIEKGTQRGVLQAQLTIYGI